FVVSVISMLTVGVLLAKEARSQNLDEVSISIEKPVSTLHELFNELSLQSDFTFVYTLETGRLRVEPSAFNSTTLDVVRKRLTKNKKLNLSVINRSMAVSQATEKTIQQTGRIAGKIFDDRGGILSGANIKIIQTGQQTQTRLDGSYTFSNIAPGSYTLEA